MYSGVGQLAAQEAVNFSLKHACWFESSHRSKNDTCLLLKVGRALA